MKTITRVFWLIAIVMLLAPSCNDKDDEPDATWNYYMLIQSQVELELSDNAEEEGTLVGEQGCFDISRVLV